MRTSISTFIVAVVLLTGSVSAAPSYTTAPCSPQTPPQTVPPVYNGSCTQCVSSPNNCDITAPCSNFLGTLYCACRPGYKGGNAAYQVDDTDTTKQWRIDTEPGHEHRVWVAPGVVCDQL